MNLLFSNNEHTLRNSESVGSKKLAPKGGETITNDVRRRLIDAHEADLTYKRMSQLFWGRGRYCI